MLKEQAASITISKIEQICTLIPALNNELRRERGESKTSTKDVKYLFKNGSSIDVLSATEKSRGQRRTGGAVEECILVDQTALNEIIIPTTVIDRRLADGSMERSECVNKSQVFITTAGYRNQFAYAKLVELLIQSILDPDSAMILGGTYRIPVAEGLQSAEYLDSLKLQDTFSEESFNREYRSRWTGDAENAFYSGEKFDRSRVLKTPEYEYCVPRSRMRDTYYVLGVDVGRIGCTTECCVFRVNIGAQGVASSKSLVNIFTFEAEHFEEQAIHLKRIFLRFQAQAMAIDANGLGVGLVDFMVKSQVDPETGDTLPPFGVINDDDGLYKKYKTRDTVQDAMYLIKANMPFNTEAYSNAQIQMAGGRIKFLVDEATAKVKLLETKEGQDMTLERRNEYLRPFVQTTILREQILNLVESNEGINIILKQASRTIPKDKFSAFIYGLYYIKLEDEKKKKKKGFNINGLIFFN